ncbi:GNAT family N-acetyltransferase [Arthrobacter sp. SX1312]|uniref:GNAT family N-acetyltransferase n=1 Tax=Arthrobacter sp. SX1312 TaxID=2058896 RepID=UPI000CE56EB9|nr:GNAT family N-acetyltransferase [Arthrobacter sp. SX1312]
MSTDSTDVQVSHNEAESRYEATLHGNPVGTAAYELSDDAITFTHTVVDQGVEGQGIGSTLIRYALDDARGQHLTVVPQCEFVAAFIEDNPDYQDLTA